jgi:hypothetical protein
MSTQWPKHLGFDGSSRFVAPDHDTVVPVQADDDGGARA